MDQNKEIDTFKRNVKHSAVGMIIKDLHLHQDADLNHTS